MATELLKVTGQVAWAKVYEPDIAFGATKWKIMFWPKDEAELEKIKKAGIQKKIKDNNDPNNNVPLGKYLEFSRDAFKVINGDMVNFTGPVVLNEKNEVIVDYINTETQKRAYSFSNADKAKVARRGSPVTIGNGSEVMIEVSVYDTQKGKGQRLDTIKVLSLVEYKKDDALPPVVNNIVQAMHPVDQPAQVEVDGEKAPW